MSRTTIKVAPLHTPSPSNPVAHTTFMPKIVQIAATCSLAVTAENVTTAIEGAMASVVTAENVTAAIDGAIHRDAKALTWSAHGKDNTEESLPKASIYLGRYNANEVLTIDVGDSGCGSGTAMQYQLVGGYGTHPRVLSLGGHGTCVSYLGYILPASFVAASSKPGARSCSCSCEQYLSLTRRNRRRNRHYR